MKRYDFDVDIYGTAIVFEKQSGPYVLFSEAVEGTAYLIEKCELGAKLLDEADAKIKELTARIKELETENKQLKIDAMLLAEARESLEESEALIKRLRGYQGDCEGQICCNLLSISQIINKIKEGKP